jgi:hypothetical protein
MSPATGFPAPTGSRTVRSERWFGPLVAPDAGNVGEVRPVAVEHEQSGLVALSCAAVAQGDVVRTDVRVCRSSTGAEAPRREMPDPLAATGGLCTIYPGLLAESDGPCAVVAATYSDGTTVEASTC